MELTLALILDKVLTGAPPSEVRIMNFLPLVVVGKIIAEGVLIYCKDDQARIEYESNIRSAYFDFLPFINSYRRMYFEQMIS